MTDNTMTVEDIISSFQKVNDKKSPVFVGANMMTIPILSVIEESGEVYQKVILNVEEEKIKISFRRKIIGEVKQKHMTVGDFIDKLKEFDPNISIVFQKDYGMHSEKCTESFHDIESMQIDGWGGATALFIDLINR